MCLHLRRHRAVDLFRHPHRARASTTSVVHHATATIRTNHQVPRTSAKSAAAHGLFPRRNIWIQCAHARRHSPILPARRIRCRTGLLDSRRLLVLLVDPGRPWR